MPPPQPELEHGGKKLAKAFMDNLTDEVGSIIYRDQWRRVSTVGLLHHTQSRVRASVASSFCSFTRLTSVTSIHFLFTPLFCKSRFPGGGFQDYHIS